MICAEHRDGRVLTVSLPICHACHRMQPQDCGESKLSQTNYPLIHSERIVDAIGMDDGGSPWVTPRTVTGPNVVCKARGDRPRPKTTASL